MKSKFSGIHFPHIHVGMRVLKTAIATFIALCLAYLRQGNANPLYIAIAAILCVRPSMESSKKAGFERLAGTFIGGFWGLIIFLLNGYVLDHTHIILRYAVVSAAIIPLIYTLIAAKCPNSVAVAGTVYLIVTVSPVGSMTKAQFLLNRMLDTFMGFAIAFAINYIKMPTYDQNAEKTGQKNAKTDGEKS